MNQAVAYARVSTVKQAEEGSSIEAQEAKMRQAAADQELDLVDVILDAGMSGKNTDRPGLQRVLEMVRKREVSTVIVPKLDRLGRSTIDILQIVELMREHDVKLLSLAEGYDTTSPHGMLVLRIMASVAELEREMTIQRTIETLQYKKSQGQRTGNIAYGKRLKNPDAGKNHPDYGVLVDDEAEQEVIRRIRALDETGASGQWIADNLNAEGTLTRSGTQWKRQYIHAILNAPSTPAT